MSVIDLLINIINHETEIKTETEINDLKTDNWNWNGKDFQNWNTIQTEKNL